MQMQMERSWSRLVHWLATMVIPRLTLGVGLAATAVNVLVARVRGLTPTVRALSVAPCRSSRSTHSIRR